MHKRVTRLELGTVYVPGDVAFGRGVVQVRSTKQRNVEHEPWPCFIKVTHQAWRTLSTLAVIATRAQVILPLPLLHASLSHICAALARLFSKNKLHRCSTSFDLMEIRNIILFIRLYGAVTRLGDSSEMT